MKLPRVNKTVTVDPVKMSLFENSKNLHGLLISDFLDQKLEEFLNEVVPDEMLKQRIQDLEAEVLEIRQSLPEVEFMMKQRRQNKKKVMGVATQESTHTFFENFESIKESISVQVNKKHMDWKLLTELYKFKDQDETKTVIIDTLKENNLYGCAVCKKWNTKTGFCSTYAKTKKEDDSCGNWIKR